MHLLHKCGISGEALWIQLLHPPRQVSDLLRKIGIALHHLVEFAELAQLLPVDLLSVLRISRSVGGDWSRCPGSVGIVAGVYIAPDGAVAKSPACTYVAGISYLRAIRFRLLSWAVSLKLA